MRREEIPNGKHLAVPTKDSETLHDGQYPERCEKCQAAVAEIATRKAPVVDGFRVGLGSVVRLKPEHQMSGDPEWVTITEARVNTYTGEVWLHAYALFSNRVLQADDIAEVRT